MLPGASCSRDNPSPASSHHHQLDPRYCPSMQTRAAIHRSLLLCPVLGVPSEAQELLVSASKKAVPSVGCFRMQEQEHGCMFTWKAKGSVLVTIVKAGPTTTIIWDHGNETCFVAAPCGALGAGCPVGTAFLAQIVMDRNQVDRGTSAYDQRQQLMHSLSLGDSDSAGEEEGTTAAGPPAPRDEGNTYSWGPSILLMDVISMGNGKNFLVEQCPAQVRYNLLVDMEDPEKGIIVSQCMRRQWAGNLDALIEFHIEHGESLPHVIDSYMQLGTTCPLDMRFVKAGA